MVNDRSLSGMKKAMLFWITTFESFCGVCDLKRRQS